jgi:hypothetical protein
MGNMIAGGVLMFFGVLLGASLANVTREKERKAHIDG